MAMGSWPSAGDVSSFLADAGFDPVPDVDFGELVDRAVDEVHSTVGFSPFLAGGSAEFSVQAKDGAIVLGRPFATVTGVTAGGASVEFIECPQGVTPIRKLVLESEYSGAATITGKPGFGLTVPIDIWYAVRDLAASYVAEMIGAASGEAIESVKQDTVTVKYRTGLKPENLASVLADRAKIVFERYRLMGMGG